MSIRENLLMVKEKIASTALKCRRDESEISVIAVTKTVSAGRVDEAYSCGIKIAGENRVLEARDKMVLVESPIEWQLIGHLQKNKAKNAVELFSLIHSLDDLELAQEIDSRCRKIGKVQEVLLQVNFAKEESKSGIDPSQTEAFLKEVTCYENIKVTGIMTIAPIAEDPEDIRWVFKEAKRQFDEYKKMRLSNVDLMHLSMGMSSDYLVAIEEGATMLRLGRALFGERS